LEKVLLSAGNFLTEKPITLRLDWMGVKQDETSAEKALKSILQNWKYLNVRKGWPCWPVSTPTNVLGDRLIIIVMK
jgi:hypothetical protein